VLLRIVERRKYEDALLRAKREAEDARSAAETSRRELADANVALDRARAAAEQANRAKSAFLATMSHELRTPLNAIAGYVQLLELGIHGPLTDEQRETLGRVHRSQQHLLRLINDVLNLSRIEAGRVEYRLERVTLGQLVDSVLPMIEPQLAARALSWSADVPADLAARADREKAEQVLLNLLSNASKFTPHGGRVRVEGARDPTTAARVMLRVVDTGVGIPRDQLGAVFEPFVQVDTSVARRTEGTGLGLAISRDLARGMGGELAVESEEGRGSTFTLALPAA
jgi:signal transduction histidine kinase